MTTAAVNGGLIQASAQMMLDVLSTVHTITEQRLITPNTNKNCFVKCGFLIDRVSSNDDIAKKLTEDEEDNWHSLRHLGVHSEDQPTCASTLDICEVRSVNQVLDQQLTISEEEPEEGKEVAEYKASFLDSLTGSNHKVHTSI
jgi:hypothetical protein